MNDADTKPGNDKERQVISELEAVRSHGTSQLDGPVAGSRPSVAVVGDQRDTSPEVRHL